MLARVAGQVGAAAAEREANGGAGDDHGVRRRSLERGEPFWRADLEEPLMRAVRSQAALRREIALQRVESGALPFGQLGDDALAARSRRSRCGRTPGLSCPSRSAEPTRRRTCTFDASQWPAFWKTLITPSQSSCAREGVERRGVVEGQVAVAVGDEERVVEERCAPRAGRRPCRGASAPLRSTERDRPKRAPSPTRSRTCSPRCAMHMTTSSKPHRASSSSCQSTNGRPATSSIDLAPSACAAHPRREPAREDDGLHVSRGHLTITSVCYPHRRRFLTGFSGPY